MPRKKFILTVCLCVCPFVRLSMGLSVTLAALSVVATHLHGPIAFRLFNLNLHAEREREIEAGAILLKSSYRNKINNKKPFFAVFHTSLFIFHTSFSLSFFPRLPFLLKH